MSPPVSAQSQADSARQSKRDEAQDELGKGVHELEKAVARLEEKTSHIETALVELKVAVQAQRVPLATWLSAAAVFLTLIGMLSAALWLPLQSRVSRLDEDVTNLKAADAKSLAERDDLRRDIERLRAGEKGDR